MNSHKKYTGVLRIAEFTQLIDEEDYIIYFTDNELHIYGKKKNKGSLAVRYLLKQLLITHFDEKINYTDIEILNEADGKPVMTILGQAPENGIYFSLSHSRERVAVILLLEE